MSSYRTFVKINDINCPDIWVMHIDADSPIGIAYAIYEYMENFEYDWDVVSVAEVSSKVRIEYHDICLN